MDRIDFGWIQLVLSNANDDDALRIGANFLSEIPSSIPKIPIKHVENYSVANFDSS